MLFTAMMVPFALASAFSGKLALAGTLVGSSLFVVSLGAAPALTAYPDFKHLVLPGVIVGTVACLWMWHHVYRRTPLKRTVGAGAITIVLVISLLALDATRDRIAASRRGRRFARAVA